MQNTHGFFEIVWQGHKDLKTTQVYAKIVDEAKRIDEEYGVSESVKEGMDKAGEAAKEIWEKVKEE